MTNIIYNWQYLYIEDCPSLPHTEIHVAYLENIANWYSICCRPVATGSADFNEAVSSKLGCLNETWHRICTLTRFNKKFIYAHTCAYINKLNVWNVGIVCTVLYFFIDVFLYYAYVLSHHVAPVLEQHHYRQLCIFVYLYFWSSNCGVPTWVVLECPNSDWILYSISTYIHINEYYFIVTLS